MSKINVFLQGESIKDIVRLQLEPQSTVLDVKRACAPQLGVQMDGKMTVFLEDREGPLEDTATLESLAGKHGVRLHAHRCRHVAVKVTYSGRKVERAFAPGVTVGAVKRWAAKEFGMTTEDAAELILQIVGTKDQPDIDAHLGTLATCPACAVAFDLVPSQRIQGAA